MNCEYCGAVLDDMEVVARFRVDGAEAVWCGEEHYIAYWEARYKEWRAS